jgi:adenine phosphoribosyltransferase
MPRLTPGSDVLRRAIIEKISFVDGHADVWRLFDEAQLFSAIVDALVEPFRMHGIGKVAGVEGRGFLLGSACALRLGAGFVAIRKASGLFPGEKLTTTAGRDYRGNQHILRLQKTSLEEGDRVLLVDDWCETGSQALAARGLIRDARADFVGLACIVDQCAEDVRVRLGTYHWLVHAHDLAQ